MRKAMAEAEVGDDVYGEDPTVNKLEETAAARLGKEAGLLVSSGSQGNLVAILPDLQSFPKQQRDLCLDSGSDIAGRGVCYGALSVALENASSPVHVVRQPLGSCDQAV